MIKRIRLFILYLSLSAVCYAQKTEQTKEQIFADLNAMFSQQYNTNFDEVFNEHSFENLNMVFDSCSLYLCTELKNLHMNISSGKIETAIKVGNDIWQYYINNESLIPANGLSHPIAHLVKSYVDMLIGNYTEARRYLCYIYNQNFGLLSDYANLLDFTCMLEISSENLYIEDVDRKLNTIYESFSNRTNGNNIFFIYLYQEFSDAYNMLGDYEKSLKYIIKSKEIADEIGCNKNILYFEILQSIAMTYIWLTFENHNYFDIAVQACNDMVHYKENMNLNSPYVRQLMYQCILFIDILDYEDEYNSSARKMSDAYKLSKACKENIRTMSLLSEKQREKYWTDGLQQIYEWLLPSIIVDYNGEYKNERNYFFYEVLLLTKGLLLQNSIAFSKVLTESGTPEIMEAYNLYVHNKLALDNNNIKSTPDEYDRISNENYLIEQQLLNFANKDSALLSWQNINYDSIQTHLKDGDIAVELFVDVICDSTYYALVAQKDSLPLLVKLGDAHYLGNLSQNHDEFGIKFWNTIIGNITSINNIYFSPSGMFYNIPIEYYGMETLSQGKLKNTQIFRLTSTREIVLANAELGKGSTIYGGIDYNAGVDNDDTCYVQSKNKVKPSKRYYERGDDDNFLYWSKVEVDNIDKILNKSTDILIRPNPKTGINATEASFRSLSGAKMRVLHVATHGFYFDGIEDPMECSGLLFAGANNAEQVQDSSNDGYLYAKDIALMDLRGLDLVVLSACDTGLGQIGYDGVFGLQRAFKKAGAKTIIMSLSRVDDEATQYFMKTFFKEWVKKKDKYVSFQTAQKKTKKKYSDVNVWQSFILLDGIR